MDLSCVFSGIITAGVPSPPNGDNWSSAENNREQFFGDDNLLFSEYYNLQNVEQPASYFQQQIQQQYNINYAIVKESNLKPSRISTEEKKEKINRYMKKRTERNFSKKIKYACRKTLADSRPRIRGRFAKNEEFENVTMASCSQISDDDQLYAVIGKEEDFFNSPDIHADVEELLSFKDNYAL